MTQNRMIYDKIMERIEDGKLDIELYNDAFSMIRNIEDEEKKKDVGLSRKLEGWMEKSNGRALDLGDRRFMSGLYDLHRKVLCWEGTERFDSFMLYNEINRPAKEQFWLPRRDKLMPVCNALQNMEDGKLDELFLSMPPRVGKTTLILMFMTWVMGRDSERSNLYSSYTDSVVGVLYNGILEVLNDPTTYAYYDMFPGSRIASTNAKDLLINLERKKRYASFTGRSLYGTLNGACDCNGYLVGDDLISGIEEAMNKDRLVAAWAKVDNNLLPRAKESAKILWIGTRWSLTDPQGVRVELLENDPKYKGRRWMQLNTPALDEEDESNFEYKYGVGFSTEYYQQRRASFERNNDMPSWFAQYQGEPYERAGSVFSPEDLRYYNGVLPEEQPDRIFFACDPAYGGGDFVSAPICFQYDNDIYVHDVVYDDGDKKVTEPQIVHMIQKYGVQAGKIEGTKATSGYGEDISEMLEKLGIKINLQINVSHYTGTGKAQRIFDKAPDIKERFLFLADGYRSKPYSLFMQNVYSFTMTGKNKHDDAPDSLAMAADFAFIRKGYSVEVFNRPW